MKATELRLGNYITTEYMNKNIFKVISIHSDRIYFESVRENFKSDTIQNYIKPIPLTEEWLINFGFEKAKHSHGYDCYIKDGFDFDIVSHGKYWVLATYTDESCANSLYFAHGRFEYVHQLQNLYFALTGSELVSSTEP